jgi:chromosome segregation ATPase
MRITFLLFFFIFISHLSTAQAMTKDEIRAEIQLRYAQLDNERVGLRAERATLAKKIGKNSIDIVSHNNDVKVYEVAKQRFADEVTRLEGEMQQHNARCGGTFDNEGFVRNCNNRANDLNAWADASKERNVKLTSTYNKLKERAYQLVENSRAIEERVMENKKALATNETQINIVNEMRHNINIDDSFLDDPKQREKISKDCLRTGSAESQSECMKKVFDGAR